MLNFLILFLLSREKFILDFFREAPEVVEHFVSLIKLDKRLEDVLKISFYTIGYLISLKLNRIEFESFHSILHRMNLGHAPA